jgi:hypothetical protein
MFNLCYAQVAQSVEHVLGKDEVGGSIPLLGFAWVSGTKNLLNKFC